MAWASMAWDLALTIFSRHFREMWRGESVFSKFSLPLNCGYKAIKNSSIVVRQPGDQTSLLLLTVNLGKAIVILLNLNFLVSYPQTFWYKSEEGLTYGYKQLMETLKHCSFLNQKTRENTPPVSKSQFNFWINTLKTKKPKKTTINLYSPLVIKFVVEFLSHGNLTPQSLKFLGATADY